MFSDLSYEDIENERDDSNEDTSDVSDSYEIENFEDKPEPDQSLDDITERYSLNPEETEGFREMTDFETMNDNAEIENQPEEHDNSQDVTQQHRFDDSQDAKLKNTIDFDSENESLWQEVIEENSLPGFKIETVHQFRSFIKVGAKILYDIGELKHDMPLTDDQKAMIADLGQFINVYGSYERWKEEKNRLIKDHNDAVNDLKTLHQKHMQQKRRLELTLSENAKLIEKYEDYEESIKTFDDMKTRNVYLESEIKKINALLGFTDLDLTEEFKKKIADTKTLDISARFLHKAWKKLNSVLPSEKMIIAEVLKKLGEILNKPFNAGKLRLQLMDLVKELQAENAEKKERYLALYERSYSNPLNNKELKEFIELSEHFKFLISFMKKLSKMIESSRG